MLNPKVFFWQIPSLNWTKMEWLPMRPSLPILVVFGNYGPGQKDGSLKKERHHHLTINKLPESGESWRGLINLILKTPTMWREYILWWCLKLCSNRRLKLTATFSGG